MKIAVAVYGIPRGSAITYPSIENNIVNVAREFGNVKLFGHLFRKTVLINKRSEENGVLADDDYERFHAFSPKIEEPDSPLDRWNFEEICRAGDIYNDDFASLRNLVHQLHSLYSVTLQLAEYAPDVVVFARPDLLYLDKISQQDVKSAFSSKKKVFLPEWQWWHGYNDRFAICSKNAYQAYGCRILKIRDFLETMDQPLHAEKFLRFSLQKEKCLIRLTKLRASRVRVGNKVKYESFDPGKTLGGGKRLFTEFQLSRVMSKFNL